MNSAAPSNKLEQQLRDMNEALLISSVKQHELVEQAQKAEAAAHESEVRLADEVNALARLNEASSRLWRKQGLREGLDEVLDATIKLLGADMGNIQIFDADRRVLVIAAQRGFQQDFLDFFREVSAEDDTACGRALRSGKRSVIEDVEADAPYAPLRSVARAAGYRAVQSTPLIGRDGTPLGMLSTHFRSVHRPGEQDLRRLDLYVRQAGDLIERARSEAALRASEIRYRRLFQSATDGILILDAHTSKITDANACMGALMETEPHELLGKELYEIGLISDKSESEAAVRELQEKGYIRYEHLPLETAHGRRVEVEVVANVYTEDNQSVIQCNIRDITERSRLERQTHEQAEALADLHRRKDEFLAMLSHELRNPLAPILNAVQLLQLQRRESGLQQRARAIIERQLGQLVHLVDDLLEVSRISTGRIHLQRERLDMRAIVESGIETVRPLIEQRRHTFALRLPSSPIWIDGDSTRLAQVVVNLLTNAAKYTDEGGHIWLSLQEKENEAVLQVRDSGVGIAPDLMPRIFDLFTQAERSLARSQGGLGIGLCLVQRLVEMHGGKVAAHSALGQGSEFIVRLPVVRTAEPQPPSPTEKSKPNGRSLRVLVVDDNVDTAESLEVLLRESGYDVRTAHDGPSALEAARDYRPNVVLLDIGLPGLDGYEVAKRMRQQPVLQNVVLVAVTGYGQESDRQRAQKAGFDHHMIKPARFEHVQKILATVSEKAT
jgi:PAS domain S-box-containing protein